MHTFYTTLSDNQLRRVKSTRSPSLTIQVPKEKGPHAIPVSDLDTEKIKKSKGKTVRVDLDINTARGSGFLSDILSGIKSVAKKVVKPAYYAHTIIDTAADALLVGGIIVPGTVLKKTMM